MYIDRSHSIHKKASVLRAAEFSRMFNKLKVFLNQYSQRKLQMKTVNYIKHQIYISRNLAILKKLAPRHLEDIGISPELVSMGRRGYPWKY